MATAQQERASRPEWLWKQRSTCRLCGHEKLLTRFDFPPMAIATTNFHYDRLGMDAADYTAPMPMPLDVCGSCELMQISVIGNPEVQYRDYAYRTTLSLGLPQHFKDAAAVLVAKLGLKPGAAVVEFGSNDGTYLRAFQSVGMRVAGIDPATEIAEAATNNGVSTYADFFTEALAEKIRADLGPVDLLVANNVIANIDDLSGVFSAARNLLHDNGAFVFETQYGRDIFDKLLLDTVYHEHLTYFNVAPLARVLKSQGLEVFDVERIPTKGGSIRVYVHRAGASRPVSRVVRELVDAEVKDGVGSVEYFEKFAARISEVRITLHRLLSKASVQSTKVAGYGVSVGTSTLLGQLDLIGKIDFLVDDDPKKPSHFVGPGYAIPVKLPAALAAEDVKVAVVFAWRFIDSILAGNTEFRAKGGKFLVPLPTPRLVG